jgi:hypothetical protein
VLARGDGDLVVFLIWAAIFAIGFVYNLVKKIGGALQQPGGPTAAAPRARSFAALSRGEIERRFAEARRAADRRTANEEVEEDDGDAEEAEAAPDAYATEAPVAPWSAAELAPPPPAPAPMLARVVPVAPPAVVPAPVAARPYDVSPPPQPADAVLPPALAARLTEAQKLFVGSEMFERPKLLRLRRRR